MKRGDLGEEDQDRIRHAAGMQRIGRIALVLGAAVGAAHLGI